MERPSHDFTLWEGEMTNGNIVQEVVTLSGYDLPTTCEITGNPEADTVLMMVHGFGVRRDSRGMFTDIEALLSDRYLCIRGEFSIVGKGEAQSTSMARPISDQAGLLGHFVEHVRKEYYQKRFAFLGHSQGCLVIAKYAPVGSKVLLLAPPVESPAERFAATPGWQRPGSFFIEDGCSRLVRSDGSITEVGSEYWDDFRQLDAAGLYQHLAASNFVKIIFAGADQVLGHEEAPGGIRYADVQGADHDFSGDARQLLLNRVTSFF